MSTSDNPSVSISIENLGLSFGETEVLKKIDLHIEAGEFFAFLGPSGSGKSTLLRAIAGFGPTPTGRILLGDQDVTTLKPWERNVGMVFQSYALWPHMTVRKNVGFGLVERKVPAKEINMRVDKALEMVEMSEYANRRPSELSGGQQQRVAIARTIVVEPKVLLLDEPLSNLDANLRVQMRRDIRALQQRLKLTTIFVTHDQEEANTTSDRMAVLDDGVLQQIGSPMELYDHPQNLFVAKFLGTANVLTGKVQSEGDKTYFVSNSGTRLPITAQNGAHSIFFRPQNAHLAKQGENNIDHLFLEGIVKRKEFLGSIIRYGIQVGEDMLLIDETHVQGEGQIDLEASATIAIERDYIQLL
ncbi:MAG: ABC transporter ATP-binding protein [Arenicellales bacterium]